MELKGAQTMIIVPAEEWERVNGVLLEILTIIKNMGPAPRVSKQIVAPYITAKEFMAAVRICRSNFDKLVQRGKIRTLKKGRKVYVVATEVERYFREVEV